MTSQQVFDVVVIGGGHAGCEAAAAAARMGAATALVTQRFETIGEMSCNPAIGGLGKGHLVREIDALDGLMARVADAAGIQFRVLNRRKGPAVRGPRAQMDRAVYRTEMQAAIRGQNGLSIVVEEAADLVIERGRAVGVRLRGGAVLGCRAVVITTGTFLRGVIHMGEKQFPAGRMGDFASVTLARTLARLELPLGRLKTGTPARLDGSTIRWEDLEQQKGDESPEMLSSISAAPKLRQISCAITRTTAETHDIIRENLMRSAMYSGEISGRGPRYCPSIEDKIVRFGDRDGHQIFLEPEGLEELSVYPNGVSTSLPPDVQERFLRTVPGLEDVALLRPGYAIEYDYVDPRCLTPGLQCMALEGLFLAGQINGTTGYEEAAAQGILAGISAGRHASSRGDAHFDRGGSYIGVMVDDLTTKGVTEPYRMFTSRSEFRLSLRVDNADERLTGLGIDFGCVGSQRAASFLEMMRELDSARTLLGSLTISPDMAESAGVHINRDGVKRSAFELLSRKDVDFDVIARIWPELARISEGIRARIGYDAHYFSYVERQAGDLERFRRDEALELDPAFDFRQLSGLSNEIRQKLAMVKPRTVGQAGRIEGVTPAALLLLASAVRRSASANAPA